MPTVHDPTATTTAAIPTNSISLECDGDPDKANTKPNSKTEPSPSSAAAAERAMSHTSAWKPALDRRQSWSAQEYKHDLHQRQYMSPEGKGEEGGRGGGGFTEV